MWPAAAALVVATSLSAPVGERVLVCRPTITGDPALARGDALIEAVRERADQLLDYGVPCETSGEAARAAGRAGLTHAVLATVDGRTEGSVYALTVVDAEERLVEVRRLEVAPGAQAARPLSSQLGALVAELRRPQTRAFQRKAALGIAGGGLALFAAGIVLAAVAHDDAARANAASTPEDYLGARRSWERDRVLSGLSLGLGAAALAGGIYWRVDLGREE